MRTCFLPDFCAPFVELAASRGCHVELALELADAVRASLVLAPILTDQLVQLAVLFQVILAEDLMGLLLSLGVCLKVQLDEAVLGLAVGLMVLAVSLLVVDHWL